LNRSNKFNLSFYNLTTANLGGLYPIGCVETLPGDLVAHHTNLLIRMSPLAAPVMHHVTARVHHFYVPNRIVWTDDDDDNDDLNDWKEFITGGADGTNTDQVPTITSTGTAGDLLDYLGIPTVAGIDVNALPIRGVNRIFNKFYRDQDLVSKRSLSATSIPKISWEKDYFTTCRPWAQKGPAVSLPLGDKAFVTHDLASSGTLSAYATNDSEYRTLTASTASLTAGATTSAEGNALYADLAGATGADVIAFREALGMQRFQEMRAKFGSRYEELMRHLGSNYIEEDSEPVYLGGGQVQVNFSEVLQTANDTSDRDYGVGDMYGHGVAAMRSNRYIKKIPEHGHIISMLSVRPKAIYSEGIHRNWLRQDREDYHSKELEFIGQQEVYDNEIYAVDNAASSTVFGYQDRFQEYREQPSYVSGEFRTSALDYWHLARQLGGAPTLNADFVEIDSSDHSRIFNEQTNDQMWIMGHHNIVARRNVAKKATARII
jgi:hypothetical protein